VSVTATPPSLLAGSGQTSTVTATVTGNGQPVSGDQVTFGLVGSACGSVNPSVANTSSSGQTATKYTAGSAVGNCTIAATDLTHSANQATTAITQTSTYQSPTAATCPTGNGIHCLSVTGTSATMTGEVSPHGCQTYYAFLVSAPGFDEWAPASAQSTDINGQPLNSNGSQYVSATATGLTPGTTYSYHVSATSFCGDGTPRNALGNDHTFTTPVGCSQTVKFGPIVISASCLRRVGLTWVASASENGSISLNGLQIVPTSGNAEVIFDPLNLRIEARGQVAVKFGPLYVGGQQVVGQVTLYQGSFDWVFQGGVDVSGLAGSLGESIGLPTNPSQGRFISNPPNFSGLTTLGGTDVLDYAQVAARDANQWAQGYNLDLNAPTVDMTGLMPSSVGLPQIAVSQSMNLLGLPISGQASLDMVQGGVQVKVHAGLGAPVNAGGDLTFTVGSDGSVSVDGFDIQVPQFNAGPLTIGDSNGVNELSFDPSGGWCASHGGGADWHASTGVTIEPSDAALSGSIDFCNGVLRDVKASVDLPAGFPLFAPQAPVLYVNGGDLDLSFNPFSVNGGHLHMYVGLGGINAILGYVGVQSYQPGSLTVEVTHASIVNLVPLPDFQATFYDGSPPGLKLKLSINHTWQTGWGPVSIDGTIGGQLALEWPLHANLSAILKVDLPGIGKGLISGVLSTKGIAACGNVGGFYAGVGYLWGHSGPDVLWTNCDLSPYSDTVYGAIDAAAGRHILVPARLHEVALKVAGRGGAPRVAVHGPRGESMTSTAAGVLRSGRFAVIPDPSTDTTYVLIAHPHGGTWTVTAAPGSVPIASVQASESLPAPSVSATVTGKGRQRRLAYRIKPIRGQRVEFSELAGRASHYLGSVRGGRGVIAFVPLAGRGGPRAIQAQVFENGMPRARLVVAHYVAPTTPLLGKPGHVRLSRRGGSLVVRWTAAFGARHYLVRVRMDGGQRFAYLVPARRRRVVVPGLFGRSRAIVSVSGLNLLNHPGRATSASLGAKRGLPACSKRRKKRCIKPVKPLRSGHAIAWRSLI